MDIDTKKKVELNYGKLKKELHELIDAGLSLSAASKFLAKKNNFTKCSYMSQHTLT